MATWKNRLQPLDDEQRTLPRPRPEYPRNLRSSFLPVEAPSRKWICWSVVLCQSRLYREDHCPVRQTRRILPFPAEYYHIQEVLWLNTEWPFDIESPANFRIWVHATSQSRGARSVLAAHSLNFVGLSKHPMFPTPRSKRPQCWVKRASREFRGRSMIVRGCKIQWLRY